MTFRFKKHKVKRLQQLTLLLASFLVLLLSFNFSGPTPAKASFQNKTITSQFALNTDDIDDDSLDFSSESICISDIEFNSTLFPVKLTSDFDSENHSIPFYIRVRNLRI